MDFSSQWSDKWDLFVKWLELEWDKVEARPFGVLNIVWDAAGLLSDWVVRNNYYTIPVLLIAILFVAVRMLRRRH